MAAYVQTRKPSDPAIALPAWCLAFSSFFHTVVLIGVVVDRRTRPSPAAEDVLSGVGVGELNSPATDLDVLAFNVSVLTSS